jgi:hypothetical protein
LEPQVKVTEARRNDEEERVKLSTPDPSVGASQLRDFYPQLDFLFNDTELSADG